MAENIPFLLKGRAMCKNLRKTLFLPCLLWLLISQLGACSFLKPQPRPALPPEGQTCNVVRSAYSQMGKSYSAGGCSPRKGFDCSGLVWWSYRQHGYKIPRITTDQAKAGKAVPRKKLKPGDILVFKTGQSPRGLHTGLYAGANAFIHSPRKGQSIRMDKLNSGYWSKTLIAARRVID